MDLPPLLMDLPPLLYDDGQTLTVTAGRHTFCNCGEAFHDPDDTTAALTHTRHTLTHSRTGRPSRRERPVRPKTRTVRP